MTGPAMTGRFDLEVIAATLPDTAATIMVGACFTNRPGASARVYRPTAARYNAACDSHLYSLSGRGTFWLGHEDTKAEFGAGELPFFERGISMSYRMCWRNRSCCCLSMFARREPTDIFFVNPGEGSAAKS